MGRELDLGHLTDEECAAILKVLEQDEELFDKERHRLSKLEQQVQEDRTKSELLTKENTFNDKNCINCFARFWFLVRRKVICSICKLNVCKKCVEFDTKSKALVCKACMKLQDFAGQQLDWFYKSAEEKFQSSAASQVTGYLKRRKNGSRSSDLVRGGSDPEMSDIRLSGIDSRGWPTNDGSVGGEWGREENRFDQMRNSPAAKRTSLPDIAMNGQTGNPLQFSGRPELVDSEVQTSITGSDIEANMEVINDVISSADADERGPYNYAESCNDVRPSSKYLSADLLRLAGKMNKSQGEITTTANRMLRSADMVSSLHEELDVMDKRLDDMEEQADDVMENNDDLLTSYNRRNQLHSAAAVSDITETALDLLTSAGKLATSSSSQDPCQDFDALAAAKRDTLAGRGVSVYDNVQEEDYFNTSHGSESQSGSKWSSISDDVNARSAEFSHPTDDLDRHSDSTSSEGHYFFNEPQLSSTSRESDSGVWLMSRKPLSPGDSAAERHQSRTSEVFDEDSTTHARSHVQTEQRQEVVRKKMRRHNSRSLTELETDSSHDEAVSLKEAEHEIYLATGKVFSIEEQVRQLEEQVLRMNEFSSDDLVNDLEDQVARAVAHVAQSDKRVSEIEDIVSDLN